MLDATATLGLAAALGSGLLIGLERERRKRRRAEDTRGAEGTAALPQAAGMRSFALAALAGGLARALDEPALVALGALAVAALAAIAYARSLRPRPTSEPPADPGLTTELALVVTYLIGVLCVEDSAVGVGAAVVVAGLLALRERLHRFATRGLSEGELHDALLLAALALVLLPLAPDAPPAALAAWLPVAPRTLLLTVVLILALQAAGHVAGRVLGARLGLALSGLFSGFVSSTATIVAMGGAARAARERERAGDDAGDDASAAGTADGAATAAAMLSTVATWVQALLLVAALAPAALATIAPVALAGGLVAAGAALLQLRGAAAAAAPRPSAHGPLRVREAVLVASLLAVAALAVAAAERRFGTGGLVGSTALAALADAHAPVAALASLQSAGRIDAAALGLGLLVAIGTNSVSRSVAAFAAGGRRYGTRVAAVLLVSWAAAAALAWALC